MPEPGRGLTWGVGLAQTLAWASSYYLPALLAAPMAASLGLDAATVFAAFSLALVLSGLLGPRAGRWIDRHGGRPVLLSSSLLFAAALVALAAVQGPLGLFAAWALLGLAMGLGLYEAAFATLVRLQGLQARGAITGITLIAGFASTVGWPLTAALEAAWGWRGACMAWAALHLLLGLPLHLALPRAPARPAPAAAPGVPAAASAPPPWRTQLLLATVFAATTACGTLVAVHAPTLLRQAGLPLGGALAVAALIGPAQVGARLLEWAALRRWHPLRTARLAALGHPLAALGLLLLGPLAAPAFALLHGAGNGLLTIAKGNLPLALFGAQGYGARQGWLMLPARLLQAATPWAFGLALQGWGLASLWLSAALGLLAVAALWRLPGPPSPQP